MPRWTKYAEKNRPKVREARRKAEAKPEARVAKKAYMQKWASENKDKIAANRRKWKEHHDARKELKEAIKRGEVQRQPCGVCGTSPAEAHHTDYSKPLDVSWLCRLHHSVERRLS